MAGKRKISGFVRPLCEGVCVCTCLPLFSFTHRQTQNAMTNKSLISSFRPRRLQAEPNPRANVLSAKKKGRREEGKEGPAL